MYFNENNHKMLWFKMLCPYCRKSETKVVDKRNSESEIRRRRECLSCAKRFTTQERVKWLDICVMKRDGAREPYSREKIIKGMTLACEKRPVTEEKINLIADCIEASIRKRKGTEIKSSLIGDMVMKKLKAVDEVAYMRFASVCRSFDNVKEFEQEIKLLKK